MKNVILPQGSASPLAYLVPFVAESLERIAPEKSNELEKISANITLVVIDDLQWLCRAYPERNEVRISIGTIETLWCFTYASLDFYIQKFVGVSPSGQVISATDTSLHRSRYYLVWSMQRFANLGCAMLPSPFGVYPPDGAPIEAKIRADEISLMALAYLLHHEIAHCYLSHGSTDARIDEEREADASAADWILPAGLERGSFEKRCLSIATALMFITAKGISTGDFDGITHPRDFERLENTLKVHVPDDRDDIWGYVVALLALHCSNSGLLPPGGNFNTCKECVDAYVEILSHEPQPSLSRDDWVADHSSTVAAGSVKIRHHTSGEVLS